VIGGPRRGEIWWAEMPDKRRPVLVLTRNPAIPILRTVLVAPITRRIRGIPTEVPLSAADGMPTECVATLDNVTIADKAFLTERVTQLSAIRMIEVCRALAVATDC
jgi:mRNA interferase MazF